MEKKECGNERENGVWAKLKAIGSGSSYWAASAIADDRVEENDQNSPSGTANPHENGINHGNANGRPDWTFQL